MKNKKSSIGISDFKKLRENDYYFVDKSLFIKDVVEGAEILLYPRPRRFGKTINLSMLKYFYDNSEDNSALFKDLAITQETEIMQKQGKHPVIFITFKDIKNNNFEQCYEAIKNIISLLYNEHSYLLDSDIINRFEKDYYLKIRNKTANQAEFEYSIKMLGDCLSKFHKANPVILIDEYDMPIQSAYVNAYYNELISFIRNLLSGCLKDNSFLEKAVLTGILRVAKESIFSGLNNLKVNSILNWRSVDKFGFTEEEVKKILADYGLSDELPAIKEWYDGYNFLQNEIYNPWSILNCIEERQFNPYWVNTSGNDLIKSLLRKANINIKSDLEILINNGFLCKPVKDDVVYADIEENDNYLWNFLLMSGYLRYDNLVQKGLVWYADLKIPNKEVQYLFEEEIIKSWFSKTQNNLKLDNILYELCQGDIDVFKRTFTDFCQNSFSYYDVSGEQPEKFYHAFVLGLIVSLRDEYTIRSNRESGYGRYDIMLIPQNKKQRGVIFEFKKVDREYGENFETAFIDAKKQITEKKYASELLAQGVENIVNVIAVFDKKDVKIEWYA